MTRVRPVKISRETLLALIERGLTQAQMVKEVGCNKQTIINTIKREKLSKLFWRKRNYHPVLPPNARALEMKARYEAGETLQQIGSSYGITRERVRQILTKSFGFNWQSGGKAKVANDKRVARRAAKDAAYIAKWGHDFKTHRELLKMGKGISRFRSPVGAFINQRNNAHQRGIEWQFNLAQWWKMWTDSGKWAERGRGRGYCMCRYGDQGPYSPENCYIATGAENMHDYYDLRDVLGPARRAA